MFEDFKDKIREQNNSINEQIEPVSLAPEILEASKESGIDPETVTLVQLFPEVLDESGNDLSLLSSAELEIWKTWAETRK